MSVLITPKIECAFSASSWTDISSHVLRTEPVQAGYGIPGVGPLDIVAGTGALSFALKNALARVTTNHCKNPSSEVNVTDDWTFGQDGVGGSVNLDATQYFVGAKSCRIRAGNAATYIQTPTGVSVPNGSSVTIHARVRCGADPTGAKARILLWDVGALSVQVNATVASNGAWEYLTGTVLNNSGGARTFYMWCRNHFNDSAADVWFDACQLELSAAATSYCDGSLGDGYGWAGTAHNSISHHIAEGGVGAYTPGHANAWPDWEIGKKARLSYAYSGSTFYKTVGYVTSATPSAGLYKERRVDVNAVDWWDFAGTQKVRQLEIQSNVTTGCALQILLEQAVIQPRATCVMTSQETYDRVFDSDNDAKTTIAAGIAKLMRNELGQAYLRGDSVGGETLEMMGRYGRVAGGLSGVAASLTSTMTELEIEYDRANIWNTVRGRTYPKLIDTSACTCVFTLQSPIGVAASQTQVFTAHYRDVYSAKPISASAIVYPFRATVDYNFGSASGTGGGDKNSSACFSASIGSNSARVEVENNSATTGFLNDFKLYGKGIYYFDPVEYEARDAVSASAYGERALDLELEYQTSQTRGEPLAQYLLDLWSEPRRLIKSVRFLANRSDGAALAAMRCEPGSRVYISEAMTATDGYYDINSVQYETVSAQETWVTWGVVAADTTGYFRLDHSLLDIDVIAP